MITGKGVSIGIGFGNTIILKNEERKIEKKTVDDLKAEMDKLEKALEDVTKETEEIVNYICFVNRYTYGPGILGFTLTGKAGPIHAALQEKFFWRPFDPFITIFRQYQ